MSLNVHTKVVYLLLRNYEQATQIYTIMLRSAGRSWPEYYTSIMLAYWVDISNDTVTRDRTTYAHTYM